MKTLLRVVGKQSVLRHRTNKSKIALALVALAQMVGCQPAKEHSSATRPNHPCSDVMSQKSWRLANGIALLEKGIKIHNVRVADDSSSCEVKSFTATVEIPKENSNSVAYVNVIGGVAPRLEQTTKTTRTSAMIWIPHSVYDLEIADTPQYSHAPAFTARIKTNEGIHELNCSLTANTPPLLLQTFDANDLKGYCYVEVAIREGEIGARLTLSLNDLDEVKFLIPTTLSILRGAMPETKEKQ
jgi:hypothetical protein